MFKSTRLAAGLAIASGLALLFPAAGNAQIRVTGGQLNGNAAFFVPGQNIAPGQTTPGTSLFDLSVQELRIESENGTTTTSVFVPTSATFDDGGNRTVDAGDTGIVQGYLSGVALTQTGNLLPFSQRETVLSFEVDSFASSLNFNGTLISPSVLGSAPLIFLPGLENATVEGSDFTATSGELQVGDLDTSLTDGLINLPSTLTFSPSGGGSNPPSTTPLLQRLNFRFEGEDLAAGSYLFNTTSNGIRFVGAANQRFDINGQSVPTPGRRTNTFRIRGEGGIVDATLTGTGTVPIDSTQDLDRFEIRGNGRVEGVLATFGAYDTTGVAFSSTSTRGNIRYNFQQGGTRSRGEASEIQFTAFPGLGDISTIDVDTSDGYDFDDSFSGGDDDDGQDVTSTCNVCGTTININNSIQVGPYVTVFTPGRPIQITGGTTNNNYSIAVNLFNFTNYTSNTTLSTNLLALSSFDISAFSRQLLLLNSTNDDIEFGSTARRLRYEIRYREIGGNRYYVIVPRGSRELNDDDFEVDDDEFEVGDDDLEVNDDDLEVDDDDLEANDDDDDDLEANDDDDDVTVITAYRLLGPSSRIFPSLVGLRQLSPNTTIDSVLDDNDDATDDIDVDDSTTIDSDDDVIDENPDIDIDDDGDDVDEGASLDTDDAALDTAETGLETSEDMTVETSSTTSETTTVTVEATETAVETDDVMVTDDTDLDDAGN